MPSARIVTQIYMLFNHALFGQGIRSLLRGRRSIRLIGVGKDVAKCLETMESHYPQVVIVEQAHEAIEPSALGTILQRPGVERVVGLSIDQNYATVFDRSSLTVTKAVDLVNAIQGGRGVAEVPSPIRGALPKRPRLGVARAKSPPRRPS